MSDRARRPNEYQNVLNRPDQAEVMNALGRRKTSDDTMRAWLKGLDDPRIAQHYGDNLHQPGDGMTHQPSNAQITDQQLTQWLAQIESDRAFAQRYGGVQPGTPRPLPPNPQGPVWSQDSPDAYYDESPPGEYIRRPRR